MAALKNGAKLKSAGFKPHARIFNCGVIVQVDCLKLLKKWGLRRETERIRALGVCELCHKGGLRVFDLVAREPLDNRKKALVDKVGRLYAWDKRHVDVILDKHDGLALNAAYALKIEIIGAFGNAEVLGDVFIAFANFAIENAGFERKALLA